MIAISFFVYVFGVLAVAFVAKRLTKNLSDYVLGGRQANGFVTALGVGAADMSGWLLMALPGLIYASGLKNIWLPLSLLVGSYLNWKFLAKRLRIYTEVAGDALTIPHFLEKRFCTTDKTLRLFSSLAILIFFLFYTVAGFVGAAMTVKTIFGLNYTTSLVFSTIFIGLYTSLGGFMAIKWIDVFQGLLMLGALIVVPVVTWMNAEVVLQPEAFSINIPTLSMISFFAWGLGYFGQPHINNRFMAIRSIKDLPLARCVAMSWMFLALLGAIATGFTGSFFVTNLENPETIFIKLSHLLFSPWIAGILLSAVLSAIMSTVSAQVLISSSILVGDFYKGMIRKKATQKEYVWVGRFALLLITSIAAGIALNPEITILHSVGFAWSGLGAAFGPVLLFSLFWRKTTYAGAIAGIIGGTAGVLLFWILNLLDFIQLTGIEAGFEMIPGLLFSVTGIILVSLKTSTDEQTIMQYELMKKKVR